MRGFIVLCLTAVVCADQLGYNYQPVAHSNEGYAPSVGGAFGSGNLLVDGYSGGSPAPVVPQAEYNKEFYSFSAPQHEFEDAGNIQDAVSSLKKNLRVIFIKGPEDKSLEKAALSLAKHVSEQRTAIYVLSKQADIGDLANKLNSIGRNNQNKPEVHFVKYRTPEDAANAQRAIQSQYDQFGGPSYSHNGGVAPVLNFASPAQVPQAPSPRAPGAAYLPSSIFRTV